MSDFLCKAALFWAVLSPGLTWCQIKVSTVTDETNSSSRTVMTVLRDKLADHPKQFTLVGGGDPNLSLIVTADCMPRESEKADFACFYTTEYAGGTTKTFMGGGIFIGTNPTEVANNFLASIAQDIVERWNNMIRANAIENLEACLMLTQSSCKVPDTLYRELKTKIINLSQYMQHGGLKK